MEQTNQERKEPLYYIKVHVINENREKDQKGTRKTYKNPYFKDYLIDRGYFIFYQLILTIFVVTIMSFFCDILREINPEKMTISVYQIILIFSMAPLLQNCLFIELETDIYYTNDLIDLEIELSCVRHEIIHALIGERFGNVKEWKLALIDGTLQCLQEYPNYYVNQKYFPKWFFMEIIHLVHDLIRSVICGTIIHFIEYIKEFFGSILSIIKIQNKNEG